MMAQTIAEALAFGIQKIVSDSAQLDVEILLAHVLQVSRSYLHTWPEKRLAADTEKAFLNCIERRQRGEPIAYITGHREFWSLDLLVTPDVLIPRPETELLVELILKQVVAAKVTIADLGTGSGAIALAIAHDRPSWVVHGTDVSLAALTIAKMNAARLNQTGIIFHQGEWCQALPAVKFNVIVSNPPYVEADSNQHDLSYEPSGALLSGKEGLQDIKKIIQEAKDYLISGGMLFLEHGFGQAAAVRHLLKKTGYINIHTYQDLAGLDRVTMAVWIG